MIFTTTNERNETINKQNKKLYSIIDGNVRRYEIDEKKPRQLIRRIGNRFGSFRRDCNEGESALIECAEVMTFNTFYTCSDYKLI